MHPSQRVLGWGKSVRLDRVADRLDALEVARPSMLDRWALTGSLPEGRAPLVMTVCMRQTSTHACRTCCHPTHPSDSRLRFADTSGGV